MKPTTVFLARLNRSNWNPDPKFRRMQDPVRAELLAEQPKIDSSIKSFASYLASGMPSASAYPQEEDQQEPLKELSEVLAICRSFSKFINQHIVPIRSSNLSDSHKETTVVTWNYLVASSQKPTQHLGRSALRLVWQGLREEFELQEASGVDKIKFFLDEFQKILFSDENSNDARLIWAVDKGRQELERRASDRRQRANANRQNVNQRQLEGQEDTLASIEESNDEKQSETT